MKAPKVYIAILLSYLIFDLSIFFNTHSISDDISFGELFLTTFATAIIYLFALGILYSIVNLGKTIFWVFSGYSKVCFVLFLFIAIKDKKLSFRRTLNPFSLFENAYPGDFVENIENDGFNEKLIRKSLECEIAGLFTQAVLLLTLIILVITTDNIYLLPAVLSLLLPFVFINCLKTKTFHGSFIRMANIKKGNLAFYIAKNAIAFSDKISRIYTDVEIKINKSNYDYEDFEYFVIQILKNMYILKTDNYNSDYNFMDSTKEFINDQILKSEAVNFTTAAGSERWEFFKVYMCYSMICNDSEALNKVVNSMTQLLDEQGVLKIGELIQWHINIGKYKRIGNQNGDRFPNKIIREDRFLISFPNYRKLFENVFTKIKYICN